MIELLNANALSIPLADSSVQMAATSPAYWKLRDYGTAQWAGGKEGCDHKVGRFEYPVSDKQMSNSGSAGHQASKVCPKCGAIRVDKQLGQEDLHDCLGWATGEFCGECYICHTLAWTREVWRVLRSDGVFWLNLGDSYNGSGGAGGDYNKGGLRDGQPRYSGRKASGLKAKDLAGIPWRAALALQADGWWLRRDVIWHKRNPMPEGGAHDRPTTAHEYVFLLSKSAHYYWDADAVKEPYTKPLDRWGGDKKKLTDNLKGEDNPYQGAHRIRDMRPDPDGRNIRSVWTMPTSRYKGAHYATWPPLLAETMIKAGSKPGDIVLDPFVGSGTTLVVARQLGRSAIGLDLSFTYLKENATKRLELDKLKAWRGG